MGALSQMLGAPNALTALLQSPQFAPIPAQPQAPDEAITPIKALQALTGGGAASGPLGALAAALSAGGPSGPQPMDEVPRSSALTSTDSAPAHDEDAGAPDYVRGQVAGVESQIADDNAPAPDEDAGYGAVTAGLGPSLAEGMGLGTATDEAAPGFARSEVADVANRITGGGTPAADTSTLAGLRMPTAPVLDEQSLYPSTKRAVLQAAIPGIAAIFAGLMGGKAAAAGLMQGAARGNEAYNTEMRQRGLLKYEKAKQQYAREVALYNQQWTQAKERATILTNLAKQAAEFDDPDTAKQWLLAQRKIYQPFGIDPLDAMPGGIIPGAQEKIAAQATKVYKEAMDEIRKNHPGSDFDVAKVNASNSIVFRGKLMTLGELAAIANIAKPVPGAPDGITSTKIDAQAIYEDHLNAIRETGREPNAIERAELRLQSLQEFAKSSKAPPSDIERQIAEARLSVLQLQRAKLAATGGADVANLNPSQVRYGLAIGQRYENDSKNFNLRAQSYDTINALAQDRKSPAAQTALVFAWMKMLDPTSTVREGEQAQVVNARGVPDTVRNLYNAALSGTRLTDKQILDIVSGAHRMYSSMAKGQQQLYDHASNQLNAMKIAPGLFLSPQGSVNDAASYRTLVTDDELLQMPPGPRTAPKPTAAPESPIAPPMPSDAARVRASGARPAAVIATPAPAAAAPAAAPARATTPTAPPKGVKIVRDKNGKLYQVVGTNPDGSLKSIPLGQYF